MGRPALHSPSAHPARRKGTYALWLKRNWLLGALFGLALASAVFSVGLFIEPCDKRTSYETTNTTSVVNVTTYENRTVLENVTIIEDVTYDVTYNVTYNVTMNVTEYVNVTTEVTSTHNITTQQPVDVVIALDASHSVSDANWISENEAGRALLRGLRNALTTDMRAGVAVWANDGIIRQALTSVEDAATIDAMADVERLPYCGPVPGPYSPKAEQYSAAFCTGAPPGVSDADHVYDVTHDASEVWGLLGVHTYYAQALLKCHGAFDNNEDAFKLCVVVTDGQISEDRYAQCDDGVRRSTMTYTSQMAGDFYDAGAELYRVDDDPVCVNDAQNRWISPLVWEFCQSQGLAECTVDAITSSLKGKGIKVLNVLVSETEDQSQYEPRMNELSSCGSPTLDAACPYLQAESDFASLSSAAAQIAMDVAVLVESRTITVEETRQKPMTDQRTTQETRQETRTSEELVTSTTEHVHEEAVTDSTVTRKTICTGSPVSFTLLLLALPLLAYLFLKPLLNCVGNCCCSRGAEGAEPLIMEANPAFGLDLERAAAARAPRRRSTVDKMLARARHLRKKKADVGGAAAAAAPSPLRAATPVAAAAPTRRRSAVAMLAHDDATDWASGVAAVYDGDDWQESVADFVIGLFRCRCRTAADDKAPNPFEESKEDAEDIF